MATLFSTHPPLAKRLQIILHLAHADMDAITAHIAKGQKTRSRQETSEAGPRIMAQRDDQWLGPFTLLQLQTLEWLRPETRLKIAGRQETFAAQEIPALSYFFEIKDDSVWKIRRMCPACHEWLLPQEYEGLYVWRCAYCGGILAQKGKLPRIFVREEKGFTEKVQRTASLIRKESKLKHPHFNITLETPGRRHCPKCGKAMRHKFYSYAFHVEIDECPECGIIWFDADELEILQCLIEMEAD
ncbi:zf-TFIIB domain-containing protein [candidate division WOR-3 bacterium]|nr:zf-TFIIB domain-containing protein [candidate division WOR-3 bacterium]